MHTVLAGKDVPEACAIDLARIRAPETWSTRGRLTTPRPDKDA